MSKGELVDYTDTLLSSVGMSLDSYRKSPGGFAATSLKESSFALAVVTNELANRKHATNEYY